MYCLWLCKAVIFKTLDTVHHQGIRLALGAFRTSPGDSLLVEANEPPFKDRREKLLLRFGQKQKSNRSNPTHNTVFRPNFFSLFEKKPNAIPTFGIRIAPALIAAGIKVRNIKAHSVIDTPPWTLNKSNRKAMNRNWSNQKANPNLKTKGGNKYYK